MWEESHRPLIKSKPTLTRLTTLLLLN